MGHWKTTPILRPRRAEQVPPVVTGGCDPEAGCSAEMARVLMCASTVASPKSGPLLHVSAHFPLRGKEIRVHESQLKILRREK